MLDYAPPRTTPIMGSLWPTIGLLIAGVTLGACTSVEEEMIRRGHSPDYASGYADGCASGKNAAGGFATAKKDAARFAAGGEYAQAWSDAYAKCERDMAAQVHEARIRNPSAEK